jgi:MFS-type transporter involved in bile tolerance (Atg22 family)
LISSIHSSFEHVERQRSRAQQHVISPLCPLLFALALQFTHSYRLAILSLIFFFVAGLLILARVDVKRAALEAGNESPS